MNPKAVPRALCALLLLACAGGALARNDRLLLPLEPAMRSNGTRQMVSPEIALRFGGVTAAGADAGLGVVSVHSVADPFGGGGNNNGNMRRDRRSDEQVCLDAFRKALVDLQQRARTVGASAVVGIVSNYNGAELDSREVYECHIGNTRGVVDLKGRLSRVAQPVTAPPIAAAAPRAPEAPMVPPAPQPGYIASGYAAIDDVDALPYLSDRGRDAYRAYLAKPTPKAFAISPTGFFYSAWTLKGDPTLPSDPSERALAGCERNAKVACRLYAVNGSVVWTKEPR